ncbi:MAG: hypothetical protein J6W81_00855 [Lentisphaeria bacterium]|nr:hypothetical protein [Lentisphaeria bacterium]
MWLGFLLVSLAGICWVGTGIVVSTSAKRGVNYNIVQLISGLILIPVAFVWLFLQGGLKSSPKTCLLVFAACFAGGVCNYFNYLLAEAAMKRGPNGLVWGIMQSGLIGTFLMGVFGFGEKASCIGWFSLFLTVSGLILSGLKKKKGVETGEKPQGFAWLFLSLAAMFFVALTHCFIALPSFLPGGSDTGGAFRQIAISSGTIAAFVVVTLPGLLKRHEFCVTRYTCFFSGIVALITVFANLIFFFHGIDLLASGGCGGLGYPVAIGVCLIGFSVYSLCILREKLAKAELIGLLSIILGIIGMSMR